MSESKAIFEKLYKLDLSELTKKKGTMSYLAWAYAWETLIRNYPDATFVIEEFGPDLMPFKYDPVLGYMVYTNMTIENVKRRCWLPVMDESNQAVLATEYTYMVNKWDQSLGKKVPTPKVVAPATMMDINKTIWRCLVKNMAMFGLGLYIYAGEEAPAWTDDADDTDPVAPKAPAATINNPKAPKPKAVEAPKATPLAPVEVKAPVAPVEVLTVEAATAKSEAAFEAEGRAKTPESTAEATAKTVATPRPAPVKAAADVKKSTVTIVDLVVDENNSDWQRAVGFIANNTDKDYEYITKQLARKYNMKPSVLAAIKQTIEDYQQPAEEE